MGNEMGNRNVSGLQEEEKSVVEETEKCLVGGDGGDEFKGENHVVPDVKDKDFHGKVDELSSGEEMGNGDSLVGKRITDGKGQDDETYELKLSSQSVEMEIPKESDDATASETVQTSFSPKQAGVDLEDNSKLDSNLEVRILATNDHPIQEQISIGRDETEKKGSTFDSTSSSNDVHNVPVEPLVEASSESPIDGEEKAHQIDSETTQNLEVEKKTEELSQEEKCQVENLGDKGNGFPVTGLADSSRDVCEPQDKLMGLTQEPKLLVKDAAEEENCEVASVDNKDGNDFPLVGSLDSSQEVCEPEDKLLGLTQEPRLLVKDAAEEENCEVASVDEEGKGFPLIGSLDSSQEVCEPQDKIIGLTQEPQLLVKDNAQEEHREVASLAEEGNGFSLVGSLGSSQEVCEPQDKIMRLAQESELMAKDGESQEDKCEVASVGEEGNGFLLIGSVGSAQEVCKPQDKLMGLTEEPKSLVKEKAAEEEKCDDASVDEDGNAFPLGGSLDSSQEICEPQDKNVALTEETKLMVKDRASQEEKCEVASVDEERNGILLFGSINSSREVFEPQDKSIGLPQETELVAKDTASQEGKCDSTRVNGDGNVFQIVGPLLSPQEVCESQDGSICLTQETKMIVKDKASQEKKCEIGIVDEEGNGFPLFGSVDPSQEVSECQEKSMDQEEKCETGSVDEEGKGFPLFGSVDSSQEASEPQAKSIDLPHQEVTVIVRKVLTVPTELTVKEKNHEEDKPTKEMEEKKEDPYAMGNKRGGTEATEQHTKQEKVFLSPSPPNSQLHEGNKITSPEGEKTTNKNPGTSVERKSPSFDFDLSLGARLSQESDRTPLLCHDKAATRSLSSRGQQTYQYSKVPLEDEEVSVEEKTIMMERSYSEKSRAPFINLLKKEEKGSITTPEKEEGKAGYRKAEKEVMLTSSKGSNGKRKPISSFFATCICCDAAIL